MGFLDFFENVSYEVRNKSNDFKESMECFKENIAYEKEIFLENIEVVKENVEYETRDVRDKVCNSVETIGNVIDANDPNKLYKRFFGSGDSPSIGDHLVVQRLGFTHHGIYYGDGMVIHYLKEGIGVDSLETFAKGFSINILSDCESRLKYSAEEVIQRAEWRRYEVEYNVVVNNCENYARWCRAGAKIW